MNEKTCTKCGQTKSADDFYSGKSQCKDCTLAGVKAYQATPTGAQRKRLVNQERQQVLYAEFSRRRAALIERMGGVCEGCGRRVGTDGDSHAHLHHLAYHAEESVYPRDSKAMSTRWQRLKEAEQHPERFALLCPICHRAVTLLALAQERGADPRKLLAFIC